MDNVELSPATRWGMIATGLLQGLVCYLLIAWLSGHAVAGWTSTLASIWMIGGIQLLSLGVIGEYTGKIYNEVKRRPRFIIDRYLNERGDDPTVDR